MKLRFLRGRVIIFTLAAIFALAGVLGGCGHVADVVNNAIDVAETISRDMPTAEDTYTSVMEITEGLETAMSQGETEFTFNAADISEDELKHIGDNMSAFWGQPRRYWINAEYKSVEGIAPSRAADVQNITITVELSNNYYVYAFIRNGEEIPEDRPHARELADVLPGIAAELFPSPSASEYDKTLAAHDWLCANLDYDETSPGFGDENGSYGAFILKKTMCQGYAEALELLLKCYTDVEIIQIVGEARDLQAAGLAGGGADETATPESGGADETATPESGGADETRATADEAEAQARGPWDGHAWNAVRMDGVWYQIDATFDDPKNNPTGKVSHIYFGQSDTMMAESHRWEAKYFPACAGGDFLYFRRGGLFAEDWDAFTEIVTALACDGDPLFFEVAGRGITLDNDNVQFIFKERKESGLSMIENIYLEEYVWKDIHVHSFELYYS